MPGRAHAESKPRVWWSTVARPVADSPVSISLLQSRHGKQSPVWQPTISADIRPRRPRRQTRAPRSAPQTPGLNRASHCPHCPGSNFDGPSAGLSKGEGSPIVLTVPAQARLCIGRGSLGSTAATVNVRTQDAIEVSRSGP